MELELPRRLLDELGVVPSYYLRYFYAHDEVLRRAARRRPARAGRRRDRARAAAAVPRPATWSRSRRCSSSAAARSTARPRSASSPRSSPATAPCTRSTCATTATLAGLADDDVVEVPARVDPVGRRAARAAAAGARAARADAARRRVRAARACARRSAEMPLDVKKALLAHPLIGAVRDRRAAARAHGRRGARVILAVDGGNSKTDLALLDADGARARARAWAAQLAAPPRPRRLPGRARSSSSTTAGLDGRRAGGRAGAARGRRLPRGGGARCRRPSTRAAGRSTTRVGNDTFAVLRAGTERGWGVAVTCGAGINCVGVAPDGRHVRFPALGPITGDWGGGYDVGEAGLSAAARSEDGRGPATQLERLVPGALRPRLAARARAQIHVRRDRGRAGSSSSRRSSSAPRQTTRSPRRSATGSSTRSWRSRARRSSRLGLEARTSRSWSAAA